MCSWYVETPDSEPFAAVYTTHLGRPESLQIKLLQEGEPYLTDSRSTMSAWRLNKASMLDDDWQTMNFVLCMCA